MSPHPAAQSVSVLRLPLTDATTPLSGNSDGDSVAGSPKPPMTRPPREGTHSDLATSPSGSPHKRQPLAHTGSGGSAYQAFEMSVPEDHDLEGQPLLPPLRDTLHHLHHHSNHSHHKPLALPTSWVDTTLDLGGQQQQQQEGEQERLISGASSGPAGTTTKGWKRAGNEPSLSQAHSSVTFPSDSKSFFKKLFAFSGLGFLVAVGYMDPGNWATDLAGGSKFGYTLLFVVLLSNLMAMFLQHLALKLGVAAERDLAQACRDAYHPAFNKLLWILTEIAIAATDLAEVIGTAVALNLLTGMPLWAGVLVTAADVVLLLMFEDKSFRILELLVAVLTGLVAVCFLYELVAVKPAWGDVMQGYLPSATIFTDPSALYISCGILGATIMPHNVYLHSSAVQTRAYPRTADGKRMAIKYATVDSTLSLLAAFFINSAILILAAAAFHFGNPPRTDITDIGDAYHILAPAVGARAAPILFGIALLASGQQSTITGTLAGQIVMEGFLDLKLRPWLRRLITRGAAIVPAAVVAAIAGKRGVGELLVLSQVVLSLQLPFAVVPLVQFTSSKAYVGKFANTWPTIVMAVLLTVVIIALNVFLLISTVLWGVS